jgi:hypothetical protein
MKRKTLIKNIKSANKSKKNDSFLYELHQTILYKGGLYESCKGKTAKVISRSTEKGYYKWYVIEFDNEFTMRVKETWIGNLENIESEEITNEN